MNILEKISEAVFGVSIILSFIGCISFFLGGGLITVIAAIMLILSCLISRLFEDGLTWLLSVICLTTGGIGALIAWVFGHSILYAAAFAACLAGCLVFLFFFILMFKINYR